MEQSKIVQYLSNLDRKDLEKFVQFVASPYFNQHEPTRNLLLLIIKEKSRKKPRLQKEFIFSKLYPNSVYDEQKLYNIMSNLKKLLNRFLAQLQFEMTPLQEELHTVTWAYDKNHFSFFTNRAKHLGKQLEKAPYKNQDYYYSNYRLNSMMGYYRVQYIDRSKSNELKSMLDYLDKYYILEKLRNSCHLAANRMLMNTQYNFSLLDNVLDYIEQNVAQFASEPSIVLYYTIINTLRKDETERHYQDLRKILEEDYHLLNASEQQDLYSFTYNYCIRKINQGKNEYQQELFELYKQGLKSGILLTQGVINEWDYKNITTLGCGLQEFEWTESFINTYKAHLPEHQRENAYNYNLANLFYNKKQFDKTIRTLNQVQFTDIKYHLNTTFLLLRTFYAKQDTEALLSLIETFRVYIIRNKKITTEQKKGYTNFLRFAKRLVLIRHKEDVFSKSDLQSQLQKLIAHIRETENVINRQWLLKESGFEEVEETQSIL
ncbi:MAG: hypothetical protein HRU40_18655 [Saprospiraceae bacterium]|nr:hypothetical protein [Saprospiraceae bacterium]